MNYPYGNTPYDDGYNNSYGNSGNMEDDDPQPEDIEYAQNEDYCDELSNNNNNGNSSETIKLHDHIDYCPNCKMPITPDMDSDDVPPIVGG